MAELGDRTYGKRMVGVQGYFRTHQNRMAPDAEFDNVDRKWRSQWLKDQHLHGQDAHIEANKQMIEKMPEFKRARYNPIRRIVRMPWNAIEIAAEKWGVPMSTSRAVRTCVNYGFRFMVLAWAAAYYVEYGTNDWEVRRAARIKWSKPISNNENFVEAEPKVKEQDFHDLNFSKSALFK